MRTSASTLAAVDRRTCRPRPGLVHVDVSWFGRSGPYAGYLGTDAVCRALAGLVQLVGPADGPPVRRAGRPGRDHRRLVGLHRRARLRVGPGRRAMAAAARTQRARGLHRAGGIPAVGSRRSPAGRTRGSGINRFQPTFPLGIYPAKDDWIGVTLLTPAQWRDFCLLVGLTDLAEAPGLTPGCGAVAAGGGAGSGVHAQAAGAYGRRVVRARRWSTACRSSPCPTMASILAHEPFRARAAVVPIAFGDTVAHGPGAPLGLPARPRRGGAVPPGHARHGQIPDPRHAENRPVTRPPDCHCAACA